MRRPRPTCRTQTAAMDEVLARVLGRYDVGQPGTVQPVAGSLVDGNWVVHTGRGRYFLKHLLTSLYCCCIYIIPVPKTPIKHI